MPGPGSETGVGLCLSGVAGAQVAQGRIEEAGRVFGAAGRMAAGGLRFTCSTSIYLRAIFVRRESAWGRRRSSG